MIGGQYYQRSPNAQNARGLDSLLERASGEFVTNAKGGSSLESFGAIRATREING
jgi:hypothetical protein